LSIGAALLSAEGAFGSLRELAQRFVGDASLRDRLVDLYARGQVLRFMAQRIISTLVRGGLPTALGSAAKIGLSDVLTRFANLGIDVQGGAGLLAGPDAVDDGVWQLILTGYPGMRIAGGTDEIMRNIIGERILALPAEPRLDKGLPWNETVGAG
jgi:alkylation response protein AidB-like acyl-CoA dehydrogenase